MVAFAARTLAINPAILLSMPPGKVRVFREWFHLFCAGIHHNQCREPDGGSVIWQAMVFYLASLIFTVKTFKFLAWFLEYILNSLLDSHYVFSLWTEPALWECIKTLYLHVFRTKNMNMFNCPFHWTDLDMVQYRNYRMKKPWNLNKYIYCCWDLWWVSHAYLLLLGLIECRIFGCVPWSHHNGISLPFDES